MPGEILSDVYADDSLTLPGWYGKLPGAGDFVNRRMPRALTQAWERWLAQGMAVLQEARRELFVRGTAQTPVWSFASPAGASEGWVQFGCLAPSHDRVGRDYPLVVAYAVSAADYSARWGRLALARLAPMAAALIEAIEHAQGADQFDAALAVQMGSVGAPASAPPAQGGWSNLSASFDPFGATSFWWTNEAENAASRTGVHTGPLDRALFQRLFAESAQRVE